MSKSTYTIFRSWEKHLRAAARADNCALFRDHLQRLGLPEKKPELMLEGTIRVMQAVIAFAIVDGQPWSRFLNMQQYNPSTVPDARYAFTFDLCGEAFARVLADSTLVMPDLADLYDYPWDDYKVAGYQSIWISHPDWSRLTSGELKHLESEVAYDLRFDYSEDELNFWFESSPDATFLYVSLQDLGE